MQFAVPSTPWRDIFVAALILLVVAAMRGPLLELFQAGVIPNPHYMKGGDYPAFWLAEQAVARGDAASLYDRDAFREMMVSSFGPEYAKGRWLYPPHFLLLLAPLSALPYALGWFTMMAATLGGFALAIRAAFACEQRVLFLGFLAPAVIANLILGQTGFLASSLLLGGLALRDTRPVLAGVLIGCLTMKPHLGLLIPFILLFERNWIAIATAAVTALGLALVSGLAFGFDLWPAYLRDMFGGDQKAMLDFVSGSHAAEMASLYSLARSLGLGHGPALALQGAVALTAIWAAWNVTRSEMPRAQKLVALVALSMLMSPYMMIYDLPALAIVAVAAATGAAGALSKPERFAAWAVYAFPIVQIVASAVFAPLGALASIAFAGLVTMRALDGRPLASHSPAR